MYDQNFLDKLNKSINLVELASEYTELEKISDGKYVGICPSKYHKEKTPSFYIETDKGSCHLWNCFGCNRKINEKSYPGVPIGFYRFVNPEKSFSKIILELSEKYDVAIPYSTYNENFSNNELLMESYEKSLLSSNVGLSYLQSRNVSIDDIKKYHLGYIYEPLTTDIFEYSSDVSGKIIIPFLNSNDKPIGFSKRWIEKPDNRGDKYRHSSENLLYQKNNFLYGFNDIDRNYNEIRITEGIFDVILATKYGAKNVVCTLGTSLSDDHIKKIKSLNMMVTLIYDGDSAGIEGIHKAANKLAEFDVICKILILPKDKDLCDMSIIQKNNIEKFIQQNSLLYSSYIINDLVKRYDNKIIELNIEYYKYFKEAFEKIPNNLERKILKDMVSNKLNIKI